MANNRKIPSLGRMTPMHATEWKHGGSLFPKVITGVVSIAFIAGGAVVPSVLSLNKHVEDTTIDISDMVTTSSHESKRYDPSDSFDGKPLDILVLGQDTRDGSANSAIGGNDGTLNNEHNSDTAMIVHISKDRSRVDIVSLPRDSIVDQPECKTTKGTMKARDSVMLNSVFASAYDYAGDVESAAACSLSTVNHETGLSIRETVVVDFAGMSRMIDALGGLDICVPAKVDDFDTGLNLSSGMQHLNGTQATQYARVRKGIVGGDGSDIMRTARQQSVVKALLRKVLDDGTLSNPSKLYQLAVSALDTVKMSSGLADITKLVGLAYSLRNLNSDDIKSQTVPTVQWEYDANRVVWTSAAGDIWMDIAADEPIGTSASQDDSSSSSSNASDDQSIDSGDASSNTNQDTSDNGGMSSSSDNGNPSSSNDVDASTGLMKVDGHLVDPTTGGYVDPDTGYITDAKTGAVIGLADKYVSVEICKVSQ